MNAPQDAVFYIAADTLDFIKGKLVSMTEEHERREKALAHSKLQIDNCRKEVSDLENFFAAHGKNPKLYTDKRPR